MESTNSNDRIASLEKEIERQRKKIRMLGILFLSFALIGSWQIDWVKKAWAAAGSAMILGYSNTSGSQQTTLYANLSGPTLYVSNNNVLGSAMHVESSGSAPALSGQNTNATSSSSNGEGVHGESYFGYGVVGESERKAGIYGTSTSLYGGEFDSGAGRGQIHLVSDAPANRSDNCSVGEIRVEASSGIKIGSYTSKLLFCSLPNTWKEIQLAP